MGNFFGNHDQVRALTEAIRAAAATSGCGSRRRSFMTSPKNIPMIYQGDDIGTEGGHDPDNRKMQRFTGLSTDEQQSLANIQQGRHASRAASGAPPRRANARRSSRIGSGSSR